MKSNTTDIVTRHITKAHLTYSMVRCNLTLSRAEPIITVHMLCKKKKCCALQENVVSKQPTLYDQETTDQYVVDCKVLTV